MKKILFILFNIILFSNSSFAQDNCKKYKNGKFKIVDAKLKKTYLIERNGNIQTEEIVGKKEKLKFDVTWLSECSYKLHPTKESIEFLKTDFTLIVEISEIKNKKMVLKMHTLDKPEQIITTEVEILK